MAATGRDVVVPPAGNGLWEVRTDLSTKRTGHSRLRMGTASCRARLEN